jgi:hypothetical protein
VGAPGDVPVPLHISPIPSPENSQINDLSMSIQEMVAKIMSKLLSRVRRKIAKINHVKSKLMHVQTAISLAFCRVRSINWPRRFLTLAKTICKYAELLAPAPSSSYPP